MQVDKQVTITLSVNGTPIPVTGSSFLNLSIIQSTTQKLPTYEFTFKDPDNSLHDLVQLVEGAKVSIVLHSANGRDKEGPYETTFRCMGSRAQIQGNSLTFLSSGVYDSAKFLGGVVKKAESGTSSDVIGKLAKECGLKFKGLDGANDKMVWMPSRQTFCDFIHKIASNGYANEKSVTSLGVTDKGVLLYKDLTTLAKQGADVKVVTGDPSKASGNTIVAVGYEILDMSGMYNFLYNYGSKLVQEKMEGTAESFEKYAATMFNNFLSIDKGMKEAVGNLVRSEYLPPDYGNTHKKFHQAEFQNKKGRGLFSNRVEFTTTQATGLEIYDKFDFQPVLPTNNKISELWSGNYIVQSKTKFLGTGTQYYEKIRGVSQGYGSNFGGGLMAPE